MLSINCSCLFVSIRCFFVHFAKQNLFTCGEAEGNNRFPNDSINLDKITDLKKHDLLLACELLNKVHCFIYRYSRTLVKILESWQSVKHIRYTCLTYSSKSKRKKSWLPPACAKLNYSYFLSYLQNPIFVCLVRICTLYNLLSFYF